MNIPEVLTMRTALARLVPPLQFGNPKQIAAVRFLERVELVREIAARCGYCEGQPATRAGEPGETLYEFCECVDRFADDILLEAFAEGMQ
jgi:hypothetical protein